MRFQRILKSTPDLGSVFVNPTTLFVKVSLNINGSQFKYSIGVNKKCHYKKNLQIPHNLHVSRLKLYDVIYHKTISCKGPWKSFCPASNPTSNEFYEAALLLKLAIMVKSRLS